MDLLIQLIIFLQIALSQQQHFPQQQMPHQQMPEIHAVPLGPSQSHGSHHGQPQFGHNTNPYMHNNMNNPPHVGGHVYQPQPGDDIPFGPEVKTDLSPELQERVLERVNELVPEIVDAIVSRELRRDEEEAAALELAGVSCIRSRYAVAFVGLLIMLIL